jgi:hypothetical protein
MRTLSEILLESVQPWLGDKPGKQQVRAALDQATLLWNLALLPQTEQDRYWRQIAERLEKGLPSQVAPEYLQELRAWLRWRKSHYGDDRRAISHYELKWVDGEPRLRMYFTEDSGDKKPSHQE